MVAGAGVFPIAQSVIAAAEVPAAAIPTAVAATVSTLDGQVVNGPELTFTATSVTIAGRALALADCDALTLPGKLSAVGSAKQGVWLSDGGWLPAAAISSGKADDQIEVTSALGRLVLPLSALRGWGATELPKAGTGDQVLIAGSVLAGTVQGVRGGKLMVQSSLDPVALELGDVLGLRLNGAAVGSKGIMLTASLDPNQPPVRLLPKPGLPLAVAPLVPMAAALAGVTVRVEGGRRVYLGALTPSQVDETGAFGVVWPHQIDRNLDGSALVLGGVRYDHGVVLHSRARLTWTLGGHYLRLKTMVGISDLVAPEGDCAVTINADGKQLWHRDAVRSGDAPVAVELDLSGVTALEVLVEDGARYDIGDHLALAGAWLLKK